MGFKLKKDFIEMLILRKDITEYNQMLLHHSDACDKHNFDLEKVDKIKVKLAELNKRFDFLKNKWSD